MSRTPYEPGQPLVDDPSPDPHFSGNEPQGTSALESAAPTEHVTRQDERDARAATGAASGRPEIPKKANIKDILAARSKVHTPEETVQAWSDAAGMAQAYSDEMIKRWKEEIDTYLVFAGLFSAILTTFNVQSYLLLQPSTPPDPSFAVLQQISAQLASFSIHPPFVNSTQQPYDGRNANANAPTSVAHWAVWLNSLWFSGLILSLAAATVGITARQWLSAYTSGAVGDTVAIARLRQYRLFNLIAWRVEDIIGVIPVLLQIALGCFLAGLLVLLWNLHNVVAAISSALVSLLGVFTIVTTLLPLFKTNCSYLTPQTRALHSMWKPKRMLHWLYAAASPSFRVLARLALSLRSSISPTFPRLSSLPERMFAPPLDSISIALERWGMACMIPGGWEAHQPTMVERERMAVNECRDELDSQILADAYAFTQHPKALSAATVCLATMPPPAVIDYFKKLHKSSLEHAGLPEDGPLGRDNPHPLLWLHIILGVLDDPSDGSPLSESETKALELYATCAIWPRSARTAIKMWGITGINAILDDLEPSHRRIPFLDITWLEGEKNGMFYQKFAADNSKANASLLAVIGSYRQVRLFEEQNAFIDAKGGLTARINVCNHLLCSAINFYDPVASPEEMKTVQAYTRDVLSFLARTLFDAFAENQREGLRVVVDTAVLANLIWRLAADTAIVLQFIGRGDQLLRELLLMAEKLAEYRDYEDTIWAQLIQTKALELANTLRVGGVIV